MIHFKTYSLVTTLLQGTLKMIQSSSISLPTGQKMPILGFGTWNASGEDLEIALNAALEAGYRHIDTATVYENEEIIGMVLKKWLDSGRIKRSDLFIVTKVPPSGNRPGDIEKWLKKSLSKLQLSYLDLYLLHAPFAYEDAGEDLHPFNEKGEIRIDTNTNHLEIWSVMQKQVLEKRTRAIGLSNFNIAQIQRILDNTKLPVSNLQIELHVYFQQKELVKFCQDNGITVTAYSPLGSRGFVEKVGKGDTMPDLLRNCTVLEIAEKYAKTPAQILLKHIIQRGIATIPKSTNPSRIKKNIELFDWELEPEDIDKLNDVDMGESVPPSDNRPGDIEKWLKKSLSKLQLSYLDLYLLHAPFAYEDAGEDLHPFNEKGEIRIDTNTNHLEIWSVMQKQVLEKRTRAIGLSNFNIAQIQRILDNTKLPVSNLQIELHVYFQQKELVKFCQDNGITVTAYSPLGSRGFVEKVGKGDTMPDLLQNCTVLEIAEKYAKTPAQILLKHIIQRGIATIPKSTNPSRIKKNIELFDWELEPEDIDKLNDVDMGESARICDFTFLKGLSKHPEFPF